jgi:hypothetical protein
MAANADERVPHGQEEVPHLLAEVTGPDARVRTADPVELTLCRR